MLFFRHIYEQNCGRRTGGVARLTSPVTEKIAGSNPVGPPATELFKQKASFARKRCF